MLVSLIKFRRPSHLYWLLSFDFFAMLVVSVIARIFIHRVPDYRLCISISQLFTLSLSFAAMLPPGVEAHKPKICNNCL